nr:glucose-1-phosphate cytidylyltransferase [Candidatus Hydrogenosomobacter endosymbioticus]
MILAGGLGSRISEETVLKPKPMVEIGGKPVLWHIMKYYSSFGINDFIICLGYKGYVIKEYFSNYRLHMCDVTINMRTNDITVHSNNAEPWTVTLVDTGLETMTGGRLKRILGYVKEETFFCMTYGDGLCDVDVSELIKFHRGHGKLATLTAIQPSERFGILEFYEEFSGIGKTIASFKEKSGDKSHYVNGGFFVLSPKVLEYIDSDETSFEKEPLGNLAREGQLMAFRHNGFWQCMDTLRDRQLLQSIWDNGGAPWKKW